MRRHLRLDVRPSLGEQFRGRVVARGEPAIGKASDTFQPRHRSPAPDPDRWTGALGRRRCQREAGGRVERALERDVVGSPVRAQRLHGFVQPLPALLESHANQLVVPSRRTGTEPDHQAAAGQQVDRRENLRGSCRPAKHRHGDGRRERHLSAAPEHGGQRRRPIQPGAREHEMVIRAEVRVTEIASGLREREQIIERALLACDRGQRKVYTKLHFSPSSREFTRPPPQCSTGTTSAGVVLMADSVVTQPHGSSRTYRDARACRANKREPSASEAT